MATSSPMSTSNNYVKYTISISQNSQNITDNTSNVTVSVRFYRTNTGYTTYGSGTVYCKINGTTYSTSVKPSEKITHSGIVLFTKTLNIEHNNDGTKKLTCSAWIKHNAITSNEQSYSQDLTTIPRASSLSTSNGTLGIKQTLNITRASSSFTHTILYKCGSTTGTIISKTTDTSIDWTPAISLSSQNTTGATVSITLTIDTYNGTTKIGSSTKTISCAIPSSVKPSCSVSVSDATGYANTYGGYIQGISKFKVVVTPTLSYGSPISSYYTRADYNSYYSSSFTTDAIRNSGSITISSKVTDKRGRTSDYANINVNVLSYTKPKINNLSINRCDSDGTDNEQGDYVNIQYNCEVTSLNNKNTLKSTIKYKKTSATTYTSLVDIEESTTSSYINRSVVIPASADSTYDIQVEIADKFGTTLKNTKVSTSFAFFHFKGPEERTTKNLFNVFDLSYKTDNDPESEMSLSVDKNGWITVTSGTDYDIEYATKASQLLKVNTTYYLVVEVKDIQTDVSTGGKLWLYKTMSDTGNYNETQISSFANMINFGDITANYKEMLEITTVDDFSNSKYMFRQQIQFFGGGSITYRISLFENESDANIDTFVYEPFVDSLKPTMGLGKLAELEGCLDVGFQTRFNNGFVLPILNEGTDLNNVTVPNIYIGKNLAYYSYSNCPATKGSFYLQVISAGPSDQLRQVLTLCDKLGSVNYERFYYSGSWGNWQSLYISEEVLFETNSYGSNGTITLSKSAANFKYLEIYFNDNNERGCGYTKVFSPNGKQVQLFLIEPASGNVTYFRRTSYIISEKTITPNVDVAGYTKITNGTAAHTTGTNYIRITRVIGKR